MKFLLLVLVIRSLVELVSNKKNDTNANDADLVTGRVFHPAEFALR